jgi:hypothetical protein
VDGARALPVLWSGGDAVIGVAAGVALVVLLFGVCVAGVWMAWVESE